ncbi:putative signal transducing protein [Leptolyngbya sp. AN02str]|uniref:putative signal transducing protein n=1 Tax=Leptolyngbya sp. AN02str TaxID=3423363 RepID=UPI003D315E47
MTWVTLKTTNARWEAEMMQQLLAAHDIPSRVVNQGMPHFGCGTPAALEVRASDRWTALLLLSPVEDDDIAQDSA